MLLYNKYLPAKKYMLLSYGNLFYEQEWKYYSLFLILASVSMKR